MLPSMAKTKPKKNIKKASPVLSKKPSAKKPVAKASGSVKIKAAKAASKEVTKKAKASSGASETLLKTAQKLKKAVKNIVAKAAEKEPTKKPLVKKGVLEKAPLLDKRKGVQDASKVKAKASDGKKVEKQKVVEVGSKLAKAAAGKDLQKEPVSELAKKVVVKGSVKGPVPVDGDKKVQAKSVKKKDKKKREEAPEDALDDLVGESDDFGEDELSEYEAELETSIEEEVEEAPVWTEETSSASSSGMDGEEVILTDAEGNRYCRVRDCDQIARVDAYCRYHYLLLWKKIQVRKKILVDNKLERYVEELTSRYPDKFLDVIRKDLRSEKDFLAAIQELEIDESIGENDFDDDSSSLIDEVRGASAEASVYTEDDDY